MVTTERRKKGSGSIQKKANGTYLGRIRISGYEPFYYTGTSEKEVQKKLNEFRIKTLKEEIIPQKQTVNMYIERWLLMVKQPSLKASSYDRLETTYLKQIQPTAVGRSQLGTLSSMEIQLLINSYTKTLSYSTLKKVYDLLSNCLRYAVAVRDIGYNPMDGVTLPKKENMVIQTKEIEIMTDTDMKLLEEAQNATYDSGKTKYWYASAYVLIANTGMRSGEALALTWDKVNLTKGTITISQNASMVKRRDGNTEGSTQIITSTKTRSGTRQIPLNSKALAALVHLKQLQEEYKIKTNFVICTATGKMVVQSSFFRIFQNMQKSLGIQQPVTIHALRHTFATHLIAAKVDIKVVSQLLGHSSVKITYDTYVHTDLSRAFSAVKTLE